MNKKITWVTPDYFVDCDLNPEVISGILKQFDIHWIVLLPESAARYSEDDFRSIRHWPGITIEFIYWSHRARSPKMILFYEKVYQRIRQVGSDIVYFNYPPTSPFELPLFWRLKKQKTVFTAHDGSVKGSFKMASISKIVFALAFRKARFIHTFSSSESALFKSNFKNANVFLIPLGLKNFGESIRHKRTDNIVFLFFGHIHSNKNVDLLIEAASMMYRKGIRGFKIGIHGSCNDWQHYEAKIAHPELFECDIRMHENSEVPDLFAQSHYLVLPYKEMSQSGTLKVAFRYLVPVITSNLKAFTDEVTDGVNGFLFRSGDLDDLVTVLSNALSQHSKSYDQLQENISRYIKERYSSHALAEQYLEMFHQVLGLKSGKQSRQDQ